MPNTARQRAGEGHADRRRRRARSPQADISGRTGHGRHRRQRRVPVRGPARGPQRTARDLQRRHARRRDRARTRRASGPAWRRSRSSARAATSTSASSDDDDWVTVPEDYNQSPLYLQAGVTAAVNRPAGVQGATATPVEWRRRRERRRRPSRRWRSTSRPGPASTDGATGGDAPPVAARLRRREHRLLRRPEHVHPERAARLRGGRPAQGDRRTSSRSTGSTSLVLADDPLPGYTGPYGARPARGRPARRRPTSSSSRRGERARGRRARARDLREVRVHDRAERLERRDGREDRLGRADQTTSTSIVYKRDRRRQP